MAEKRWKGDIPDLPGMPGFESSHSRPEARDTLHGAYFSAAAGTPKGSGVMQIPDNVGTDGDSALD